MNQGKQDVELMAGIVNEHSVMGSLTKILLVDDEPAITDNLAPLLERSGFAVQVATTGEQALRAVKELAPDLSCSTC